MTTPGARELLLDRREEELARREGEYAQRLAARKRVLKRWSDEEAVRNFELAQLSAGLLSDADLTRIRARRVVEDVLRDSEIAAWELENDAVATRMLRADAWLVGVTEGASDGRR